MPQMGMQMGPPMPMGSQMSGPPMPMGNPMSGNPMGNMNAGSQTQREKRAPSGKGKSDSWNPLPHVKEHH